MEGREGSNIPTHSLAPDRHQGRRFAKTKLLPRPVWILAPGHGEKKGEESEIEQTSCIPIRSALSLAPKPFPYRSPLPILTGRQKFLL